MKRDFQRYLRAKRTVDDRALDRRLVDKLREGLASRGAARDGPIEILEVGAGIGTMIARFLEWDILPAGEIQYTAIDLQSENIAELPAYISAWAADRSITVERGDTLTLAGPGRRIDVEATDADALEYAERTDTEYDLLVGAALLDILDLSKLESLLGTLAAGGLYYFPITFDGGTRFLPTEPADRSIERQYHRHMDAKEGGSSRAGGETLARLQQLSGVSVAAGGSDWIVKPATDGRSYPGDEAYFLGYILETIEEAVSEIAPGESDQLDEWLTRRRAQLDRGELVYLTHQLDLFGQVDDPTAIGADQG
jgi:hypothetical protein